MIQKALEYVNEINKPFLQEIGGKTYSDKHMTEVAPKRYAGSFELTTLTSLVEYLMSGADEMAKMFVHVQSPTRIEVFSVLDDNRKRETLVTVKACLPKIYTDEYMERESFNIALQSKFEDNADKELLLKFVGTMENGTVAEYGDDGVSQQAVIKTGIASKGAAIVPNPVKLRPYRTFVDIQQPESSFVFRVRDDGSRGIACAIYEADGGAWKIEAMDTIKKYLKDALAGNDNFIVIS